MALLLSVSVGYVFNKPKNGEELYQTLLNEKDIFLVIFHDKAYDDQEYLDMANDVVKQIDDQCGTMKLTKPDSEGKGGDYVPIDVLVELGDDGKQVDTENLWDELLY